MENEHDIRVFFRPSGQIVEGHAGMGQGNDPREIPGYDNLLRDWVLSFALDLIPSKAAASGLDGT